MKILSIILFTTLLPYLLSGQQEEEITTDKLVIIETGVNISAPLGPFDRNIDHALYGAEIGAYFQLNPEQPYVIGFNGFYNYIDSYSVKFIENIEGQNLELEEKTSSHLTTFLASLRYYPDIPLGKIKPYVQVAMGAKVIFTQTIVTDTDGGDIINEYDLDEIGASLTYGGTLGFNLQLSSLVFLNGKVSYLPGNSMTYYSKLPSAEIPQSEYALDAFKKINSTTPIVNYSLGISFFL